MKNLFFILALLACQRVIGQDYGTEPEWSGSVVFVDSTKGHVILESQKCSYEQNRSASSYVTGVGKVKGKNCVNGSTSNIVFEKSDTLNFIARYSSNDINPSQLFNIFKLDQKKNNRCVLVASSGTFTGTKISDITQIQFVAKKYGESSYLIQIVNLERGEYAITFEGSRDQFNLFSVEDSNYIDEVSSKTISINDTVYFKAGGKYVKGRVESIEKYGVRAKYLNKYGIERSKYVNFEYLVLNDPRN